MTLRVTRIVILAFITGLFSTGAVSQDQPVHIKLSDEDQFVIRSMALSTKSSGESPNILAVEAFDPQNGEFVFARAGEGKLRILAKDISNFTFQRLPQKQQPMEQSAPWHIEIIPGEIRSIDVPTKAMKFESGQFVVSDSKADPHNNNFITEVNRIEYVPKDDKFVITIQFMTYKRIVEHGQGDPTGRGKRMM